MNSETTADLFEEEGGKYMCIFWCVLPFKRAKQKEVFV